MNVSTAMRCAVVSTSTGSLDSLQYYDPLIHILRLNIHLDGQTYTDGDTLKPEEFYAWMRKHPKGLANTTPPSKASIRHLFNDLVLQGYEEVIVVTISHTLSDTYQHIKKIAAEFDGQLTVHMVDTETSCWPEGFFAIEAARLLRLGISAQEVTFYLLRLIPRMEIIFCVDSLHNLRQNGRLGRRQNGRLGRAGKLIADMLDFKPILHFYRSSLTRLDIVRHTDNMLEVLSQTIAQSIKGKNAIVYGLHTGNVELYEQFAKKLQTHIGIYPGGYPISPVVGAHIGLDAVGICIIDKILG